MSRGRVRRRRPVCQVKREVARRGEESAGWPSPSGRGTQEPARQTQLAGHRRGQPNQELTVKAQATARGSSTHSSGPGTPARGDPPQQPRVTGLQQAGPGAPGRGAVSRSHQPHQPLMQHSIGGGAPGPGLVIGAAVYPKIPQQIQITGQQARILQGQVSDQRRGLALPGISALRQHRDAVAGLRPQDFDVNQPDHRVYRRGIAREAPPHLLAGDRAVPQGPRSSHSQRRHTASEPAPPAPQLTPQHQPTACPDSPTRPPIPELEHMCTAVRAGSTTASRPDSAISFLRRTALVTLRDQPQSKVTRTRTRRYGRVTLRPVYRRSPHRTGLFVRSGQAEIRTQLLCSSAASDEAAERSGVEWSGDQRDSVPRPPRRAAHRRPAPVSVRGIHPAAHRFPFRVSTRPASQRSIACCPGQAHPSVQRPVTVLPGG